MASRGSRDRRPGGTRNFDVDRLGQLKPELLRQLVHVLIRERAIEIQSVVQRHELVDFHVTSAALLRDKPSRIRLLLRISTDADVEELTALASSELLADALLIETRPGDLGASTDAVHVLSAGRLVELVTTSPLFSWNGGLPQIDFRRAGEMLDIAARAEAADPLGIKWLATLALNRTPVELASADTEPERLLERVAFRLLTTVFRFGGERLGEAASGERAPDAVLVWPCRSPNRASALLDCKAAGAGYNMSVDDERALVEYVGGFREPAEREGHAMGYVIILSAEFEGDFYRRQRAFKEAGVELVYLRAADLARFALEIETLGLSPTQRELIDWARAFATGTPTLAELVAALPEKQAP